MAKLKKLLIVLAKTLLALVLMGATVLAAAGGYTAWKMNAAEQSARTFCAAIETGVTIDSVVSTAQRQAVIVRRPDEQGRQEFQFPYPIRGAWVCRVGTTGGRVSATDVIDDRG